MEKKKFVTLTFVVMMFVMLFIKKDVKAANVIESKTEGNISWTLYDDGLLDINGNGMLDKKSFSVYSSLIKKVTIGTGIDCIGEECFSGFQKLESVTLPDSITSIEGWAFYDCSCLSDINIPNSVTSMGWSVFVDCAFSEIKYPESMKYISQGCFSGCKNLKKFTIPDSVESIEAFAFKGCSSLTTITIPNSVTTMRAWYLNSEYGETFAGCTGLKSVFIPRTIHDLPPGAFQNCTNLTSVTIEGNTKIYEKAFANCTNLLDVVISESQLQKLDDEKMLESIFYATPWLINREGSISGAAGDFHFSLHSDGTLYLMGDGIFNAEGFIDGYRVFVKTINISENTPSIELKYGHITHNDWYSAFPNIVKFINNSKSAIVDLSYTYNDLWVGRQDYSWCDITNQSEAIAYLPQGTVLKVNKKLPKYYTITFDGNGATSGCMDPIRVDSEKSLDITQNNYRKYGYVLTGWDVYRGSTFYDTLYLRQSGTFTYGFYNALRSDELVFKAIWRKAETIRVFFDSNGGIGSMDEIIVYEGEPIVLPENGFKAPKGKEFDSWKIHYETYKPGDSVVFYDDTYVDAIWVGMRNVEEKEYLTPNEEASLKSGTKVKVSADALSVIIKSVKNKKSISVPSKVKTKNKEYPVTELAKKAISGKKIKTVTIDATNLKKVDKNAFKGAKNLKKVIIKGTKKKTKIAKQIEKAAKKANKNVKIVYK